MKLQKLNQNKFSHFIGVDVGKYQLAIHNSQTDKTIFIDNNKKDIFTFFKTNKLSNGSLLVCEASGGYEAILLACAVDLNIAAHRANARKVKSFIASYGMLAKTDFSDARAIAIYAKERFTSLELWGGINPINQELQTLVLRRDDLLAMRVAEKNRLQAPGLTAKTAQYVKRSCENMITMLNHQIKAIENMIYKLISQNEEITIKYNILKSIAGIGSISAVSIIAHMPEIGNCTRRKAASLAGVAPHPKDSGKHVGYRNVRGGRHALKKALYMPALSATKGNSKFAIHYQSLRKNGKKPIVAITAIMRKIITIANAKVRDELFL